MSKEKRITLQNTIMTLLLVNVIGGLFFREEITAFLTPRRTAYNNFICKKALPRISQDGNKYFIKDIFGRKKSEFYEEINASSGDYFLGKRGNEYAIINPCGEEILTPTLNKK